MSQELICLTLDEREESRVRELCEMFESNEKRSYHTFIRTRGMTKRYQTSEDAFSSMQRSITGIKLSRDAQNQLELEIKGPSFAYNQILRVVGLISEICVLDRPDSIIAECFSPKKTK